MTITDFTAPHELVYPVPACPAWCPMPDGHDDGPEAPGNWSRFHVAWSGTMTYRDCLGMTAEVMVEVAAFEACDVLGEYVLSAPRVWIRGVDVEGPLAAEEMATFADLIGQAASTMRRITGRATQSH